VKKIVKFITNKTISKVTLFEKSHLPSFCQREAKSPSLANRGKGRFNSRCGFAYELLSICLIALLGMPVSIYAGVGGDIDVSGPVNLKELLTFAFLFLGGLGVVFGVGLAFAAQKFAVVVDPKIQQVRDVLPGANCGACGFGGCQGYAEAVATKSDITPDLCIPGKSSVANAVANITGKTASAKEPNFARVMCQGGWSRAAKRFSYEGIQDCRAVVLAGGGDKRCAYGCLGYGTCEKVCPFHAIRMTDDHLPFVDITKCTGCGKCEQACPRKVISILPASKTVMVACNSRDRGAEKKRNCQFACIACGICVKVCPFDSPVMENNLSKINPDRCRVCGLCRMKCPTKAIADFIPTRPKAVILDTCIGCAICSKVCPVGAASGEQKKMHAIDRKICIGCGICTAKCPVQAIDGTFNAGEVFALATEKKKQKTA
jgi:Na+-translocating ferredoxin:NAD+ oxidoreductase RNF subunit RnfB